MRVQACATNRKRRMSNNAMMGKGRAIQCRAVIQGGRAVKENITSGQFGDCLVYSGLLIYIEVCTRTMVRAPYIVNYTVDGTIFNRPIRCCALWESME